MYFFNILNEERIPAFPSAFLAIHIGLISFQFSEGYLFLLIKCYRRVLLIDIGASVMVKSVLGQLGEPSPFPEQWWYSWILFIHM